jgi:Concanavalin A-like lectin/glucanases superfamily
MRKILRFFCVLGVLILSFTQSKAAPASTNKTTLRLGLELRDGSHIVGKSLDASWRFHSALLGDLKLPVTGIRSLEMAANDKPVRLTTTNGDVLNGQLITSVLRVETSFGNTELPVKLIRSVKISPTGDLLLNTPNLLGYWRFDAAFQANSCVNGYTGELQGNARIGAAGSGRPLASDPGNQALLLDGYNSYLTTSLTGQIENQGTILAWIYLTAHPSTGGKIFTILGQSERDNDFDFQIGTDNHIYFFTDTGTATIGQAIPLNQWHFLAATFVANSTRNIYLDGQLVASAPCGSHSVNNNPVWIGNNQVFGPRCFQGRMDDVAIFNRALSAEEIQAICTEQNGGEPMPPPPTPAPGRRSFPGGIMENGSRPGF